MITRILTFILILFIYPVFSQVNVQFIPELQGRNVDGLLNIKLVSSKSVRAMSLTITVTERKGGKVLYIKTPAFSINPGSNVIPITAIRPAKVQFNSGKLATVVQQSGLFPEGEYEYCFTLTPEQGYYDPEVPAEQCFTAEVAPFSPLNLIEPGNLEKLCETRPILSWQPCFPAVPGAAYQLLMTEIKETQSAVEALNYNLPILNQMGISNPVLPYPPSAPELKQGKKYAWQVSLYKNQTVLNRSEVWEFTMDCKDTVENDLVYTDDGYRDIEDLAKGNYYVANGVLKFVLHNSYSETDLNYTIQCLTDPTLKIKRLPQIKTNRGKNKIAIDLRNNNSFKDNYSYILKVQLSNSSEKSLRFLYKKEI